MRSFLIAAIPAAVLSLWLAACAAIGGRTLTPDQALFRAAGTAQVALTLVDAAVRDSGLPAVARAYLGPAAEGVAELLDGYAALVKTGNEADPKAVAVEVLVSAGRLTSYLAAKGLGTVAAGTIKDKIAWAASTIAAASEAGLLALALHRESQALIDAGLDPTPEDIQARIDAVHALKERIQGGG